MEFLGYLPAVDGLDVALKAAGVRLQSCRRDGGGLVSLLITGEVAAVKASLSSSVIARPADQLAAMLEQISPSPLRVPGAEKREAGADKSEKKSLLPAALPPGREKEAAPSKEPEKELKREESFVDKELGAMTLRELRALARRLGLSMGEEKIRTSNRRTLIAAIEREQGR